MRKPERMTKRKQISARMLFSYLVIMLAPAVAILVIYEVMQGALFDIQKEKARNLSMETSVTLNKEIEQLSNVARYVASDENLKDYLSRMGTGTPAQESYRAYKLAKSFPDYAMLNSFIRDIYIMPLYTDYLIRIPCVVPNDARGMAVLEMERETTYQELAEAFYGWKSDGVLSGESFGMEKGIRIVQHFNYAGNEKQQAGVVVVELDWKEIKNLLSKSLWTESGMAFLSDEEGRILYVYDSLNQVDTASPKQSGWKEYLEVHGWEKGEVSVCETPVGINHMTLVTVMPREELLVEMAAGKYAMLALCISSLLIGVAICFWYWNKNQTVLDRYFKFTEKYPGHMQEQKESMNMWQNFGGILERAENLQITLERQKERLQEGIIRKILHGIYDSGEELSNELREAGLKFPVQFPCILAGMQMDGAILEETGVSVKELEAVLEESLRAELPYPYIRTSMGYLNYLVLIRIDEQTDGQTVKSLFEAVNYAVYSQIPATIYTGISETADSLLTLTEEYEHVCRACEYARYYKLRIPCLTTDLPRHQHVVFTVDLEIQLEKTVKNGTKEQLEAVMSQVHRNYFYLPKEGVSKSGMPASYNLEVLRCILLRCLGEGEREKKAEDLLARVHTIRTPQETEAMIWQVWQYFEERRNQSRDQELERLKAEAEKQIEREYSNAEYSLAMLADELKVPEKKLYRDFKKMYGVSFSSYLEMKRISYAQKFLKEGRPVTEVAAASGYGSDYSFRRAFKRVVGVAPSDYQKIQENGRRDTQR